MRFLLLVAATVGGLVAVGLLLLLQRVMQTFHPGWTLPFSAGWGLLLSVPALAAALLESLRGMGRRTLDSPRCSSAKDRQADSARTTESAI